MKNKICPSCKTENEQEYTYCKNCGTPLSVPDTAEPTVYEQTNAGNNESVFIDGNPIDKVVTFVGKNADKIVPKFIRINEGGSKIQWCWPPFIWGFFLGPIGVAIWFLYRKMYKPACVFGAVSVVFSYIAALINRFFGITSDTADGLVEYLKSFMLGGPFDYKGFLQALANRNMFISSLLNSTESIINLACALVAGLLGVYIYKKHTAKKISLYKPISNDPNYVKIGLAAAGGTSPGAAVLGLIIISAIANIPSFVFSIIKFVRSMYGL